MRISPPGRVAPRLLAVAGLVTALIVATAGPSTAAPTSTAGSPAAAATTPPAASDVNHQKGDATEFAGYSGVPAGAGAAAAADDAGVSKPGSWTPKGTNGADNPDVAGQQAANKVPDKIVNVALPTKPTKASVVAVREALQNNARAQVTVLMKGTDLTVGASGAGAERVDVQAAQADLARTLAGTGASKISTASLQPAATYRITGAGLDALLADPTVADVTLDGAASAELASSTAVIQSTHSTPPACSATTSTAAPRAPTRLRSSTPALTTNTTRSPAGSSRRPASSPTTPVWAARTHHGGRQRRRVHPLHRLRPWHPRGRHRSRRAVHRRSRRRGQGCSGRRHQGGPGQPRQCAVDGPVLVDRQRAAAGADPEELHQSEHRCGEPVHRHQRHVHPGAAGVV